MKGRNVVNIEVWLFCIKFLWKVGLDRVLMGLVGVN